MATSSSEEIWAAVKRRRPDVKGWDRVVDSVRDGHDDVAAGGHCVAKLGGALVAQLIDLLEAEADFELARERMALTARRRKLAKDMFWQVAHEMEALDPDGDFALDLSNCCIRVGAPSAENGETQTMRDSLKVWHSLVTQALESPLVACRMAEDPTMPRWLRQFGKAVSNTDAADPSDYLAPALRRLVETWLEKPHEARSYGTSSLAADGPAFLRPMAGLLGLRRRWDCTVTTGGTNGGPGKYGEME